MPLPASLNRASVTERAALASVTGKKGLSISEAKKGLLIFFGIPAESVQLTISG